MNPLALTPPDRGLLLVVSGPSGVGKSTLVRAALQRIPDLSFSVSATTRPPRLGEEDGVQYRFVDHSTFAEMVEQRAFIEHAQVYDQRYGTLAAPTEEAMATGRSLLLDLDVQGAAQVRQRLPEAVHVFVLPPNLADLATRLRGRGSDDDVVIARRMALAHEQLRAASLFDYIVVNDDLDTATSVFEAVLLAELHRTTRRQSVVSRFDRVYR